MLWISLGIPYIFLAYPLRLERLRPNRSVLLGRLCRSDPLHLGPKPCPMAPIFVYGFWGQLAFQQDWGMFLGIQVCFGGH